MGFKTERQFHLQSDMTAGMNVLHRDSFDRSLSTADPYHYAQVTGRDTLEEQFKQFAERLPVDDNGKLSSTIQMHRNCPLCSGVDISERFVKYHIPIVRCDRCCFEFANPIPHPESDYGSLLEKGAMTEDHLALITQEYYRECARLRFTYELQQMVKYASRKLTTYLEIGCSIGTGLDVAREMGLRTTGIEPVVEAAKLARLAGHEVVGGFFTADSLSGRLFDSIACMDVLEHVIDPLQFMRDIRTVLVDGGIVLFQVPNAGSLVSHIFGREDQQFNGLIHLNYFTPETLDQMAEKAGFISVKSETVLSELGKLRTIKPELIARALNKSERNIEPVFPLSQDWINENMLGYKVVGIFKKKD